MSNIARPAYQEKFELHYDAVLGMFQHLITRFADMAVEIAARIVALAAPLPNAINMYNVAVRDLGYHPFAAFAFALTLEIVVFLLVEVALKLWDGYMLQSKRYRLPLYGMVAIMLMATAVVMSIIYTLEPHKIMALLPVVSLCAFVGIGLKRWDERHNEKQAVLSFVPEVQSLNDDVTERRKQVATHYRDNPNDSYQNVADALNVTSKTTVYNDVKWLEKQGVLHVERNGKTQTVNVNGQYETFIGA